MEKKSRQKNPYKAKRHKKRSNNDFFKREKKLNRLITRFVKDYYRLSRPPKEEEYNRMNKQRLEIKRIFSLQENVLWKQNYRRKRFYYEQLNRFKLIYPLWKRATYYIYLHQRYGVPKHLEPALAFYIKVSRNISYTIFTF